MQIITDRMDFIILSEDRQMKARQPNGSSLSLQKSRFLPPFRFEMPSTLSPFQLDGFYLTMAAFVFLTASVPSPAPLAEEKLDSLSSKTIGLLTSYVRDGSPPIHTNLIK